MFVFLIRQDEDDDLDAEKKAMCASDAISETTARRLSDNTSTKPTSVFTNALGLVERTAKTNTNSDASTPIIAFGQCATKVLHTPLKRGRGRPRKSLDSVIAAAAMKRGRGRPRKSLYSIIAAGIHNVGTSAKIGALAKAAKSGKTVISGQAEISGKAVISGKSAIAGKAGISGSKAVISGKTATSGKPALSGKPGYSVFTNALGPVERTATTNTNSAAAAPIIAFGQCATKVLQSPLKRGRGRPRKSLDSIIAAKIGALAKAAKSGKASISGKPVISCETALSGKTAISGKAAMSGKTAISVKVATPAKVASSKVAISAKPWASAEKSEPAKDTLPKRPRGRPRKSMTPDGAGMTQLKASRDSSTDDVSNVAPLESSDVDLHRVSSGKVAKRPKPRNKTKQQIPELSLSDDPRRSGRHRKLTYKFLEIGLLRRCRECI